MNRVMLVGRIQEIVPEDNICNIFLKVRNDESNNIIVRVIINIKGYDEEFKTKLSKQSLMGVYGYLDGIKDKLVVTATKISILASANGGSNE